MFISSTYAGTSCRCKPNQDCWPKKILWDNLRESMDGKLFQGVSYLKECIDAPKSEACETLLSQTTNPFYLEEQPTATQSTGWFKAWENTPSNYVAEVMNAQDIAKVVKFAKQHNIKIVIKGTGHDYLGRNNAPDSILIWTHQMRATQMHTKFIPHGCSEEHTNLQSLSVQAGTRWLEAYDMATNKHNRYVQGGGCTSVGAAGGFVQGGGYGSLSRQYGSGASGVLEFEVIIANGDIVIANECQNQDLYWALKGGGGSTFGVVSKIVYMTHPSSITSGIVSGEIKANSDAAFLKIISKLMNVYKNNFVNAHWGEMIKIKSNNTISLALVYRDLKKPDVELILSPLKELADENDDINFKVDVNPIDAVKMWDPDYMEKSLGIVVKDTRSNQPQNQYWWKGDGGQVSMFWHEYQSTYLPKSLLEDNNIDSFAKALFDASRFHQLDIHINKGLYGSAHDAQERQKNTSMTPKALDAIGLLLITSGEARTYPNIIGKEPNLEKANVLVENGHKAMKIIKDIAPNAGSYANEASYFQENWQEEFWGDNYDKLFDIKNKYDPNGLFFCHQCVGSEIWSDDGMCKKK
jgi:hypothetical protein